MCVFNNELGRQRTNTSAPWNFYPNPSRPQGDSDQAGRARGPLRLPGAAKRVRVHVARCDRLPVGWLSAVVCLTVISPLIPRNCHPLPQTHM